jgi:hypothetical protein
MPPNPMSISLRILLCCYSWQLLSMQYHHVGRVSARTAHRRRSVSPIASRPRLFPPSPTGRNAAAGRRSDVLRGQILCSQQHQACGTTDRNFTDHGLALKPPSALSLAARITSVASSPTFSRILFSPLAVQACHVGSRGICVASRSRSTASSAASVTLSSRCPSRCPYISSGSRSTVSVYLPLPRQYSAGKNSVPGPCGRLSRRRCSTRQQQVSPSQSRRRSWSFCSFPD